jgi:hypothetical protein
MSGPSAGIETRRARWPAVSRACARRLTRCAAWGVALPVETDITAIGAALATVGMALRLS